LTSPDGAGPDPEPTPTPPSRPGSSTFTIEGRAAPALFVVGWLATLLGLGLVVIGVMSGAGTPAIVLVVLGLVALSIGLVAGAGSQGIERRARGDLPYQGPSPLLVFIAAIPISLVAVILLSLPLVALGVDVDSPFGRFLSVGVQTLVYIGLIRLLIVDAGALSWPDMGVRRPDAQTVWELLRGAGWALVVIGVTIPVSAILLALFPVTPVSPLPPTGELTGFVLQFVAGAVIAPVGEELLFRGLATTAWVRGLGVRRGVIRAALVFALAHILTVSGNTAQEAAGLAIVGFATRVPVAVALGWLFVRRGSIWAPIGLHMTFNGILLLLGELALRTPPPPQ
jgi:membrane protease YdiL (CAAX protease family)